MASPNETYRNLKRGPTTIGTGDGTGGTTGGDTGDDRDDTVVDTGGTSDADEFAKQTGGKPIESDATTAKELGTGAGSYNPVTRAIAKKQQNQNKTAADIYKDVMGGDLNKGGLLQKPKRKPKKSRGKGLGSR